MAKFCSYCGQPIEDGAVCTCPQAQAAAQAAAQTQAPAAAPAAAQVASQKANEIVAYFKNYLKAPVACTGNLVRANDVKSAGIYLGGYAIISGLWLWLILANITKVIEWLAGALLGGAGKSVAKALDSVDISAPFISSLLFGILMAVVVLAVVILAVFVMIKVAKINADIKHVVVAVGANVLVPTAALVLSAICFLFYAPLGILFAAAGICAWIVVSVMLLYKVFGLQDSGNTIIIATVVLIVAIALGGFINSKLLGAGFEKIEVEGTSIGDAMDDFDVTDMLGDLF